jgi:hypothetical protein
MIMSACFISYSWDSWEHKNWVAQLAATIGRFGINVVFDQSRDQNPDGGDIPSFVQNGILESDYILIVVTCGYVLKADASKGYIGQESTLIKLRRSGCQSLNVLPLLRDGETMPAYLHGTKYIDMRYDGQYARKLTEVLWDINALNSGIALREAVFNEDDPLPGKVFAIELLPHPQWVRRQGRKTSISLSREGVELGIYTTNGKKNVVKETFSEMSKVEDAKCRDREIHCIIRSEDDLPRYCLQQPNMRWASGGVLSRVEYQGRTWFSFFFVTLLPSGGIYAWVQANMKVS